MQLLEERIIRDGEVRPGGILKIDGFLNHQIDPHLCRLLAQDIYNEYKDCGINKILTIEASGIALACFAGEEFGCPVLFAKKSKSSNISDDVYHTTVHSFTHGNDNEVVVSKQYLKKNDVILVVDDFLANGAALRGLAELISQAGAKMAGAAIAVEKTFQKGGDDLRAQGMRIYSLAQVSYMDDEGHLEFRH